MGCSASSSGTGTAPTVASARALLARHAHAVLARSASGFLADVDPARQANAFRGRQRAEIAGLAGVPLSSWAWTVVAPVTNHTQLARSARRYGVATLILQVTLRYRLRGIDTRPDRHDQWLTFVTGDGRTYLAGDDDLADIGSTSWRGPWDFGPISTVRGTHCLVLGPAGDNALAAVAAAVDAAVPAVTAVWGRDWARRVAVIVPASTPEFTALTGQGGAVRDISATAVTAGLDPIDGLPYGQRLVLAPRVLTTLSAVGERIVLRHELTHIATAADTALTTPRWVVEGFADYVGNLGSGQSVRTAASELGRAVTAGRVPTALPTDNAFAASGATLAQVYEQAWLACRLVAVRAGQAGLVRFYRLVGTAVTPPAHAVAAAVRRVLGATVAGFTAQWRAYLRRELG